MPGFLPDTSCMVAAVCAWHEHHTAAARELERRLEAGEPMIVAAPALVETYAVLTRLPPPHRLAPADALALLEPNFLAEVQVVALDAADYRGLLRGASSAGLAGGAAYDAVIAACAARAGATTLLTFNERHFAPLAGSFRVVVPA